MAALAAVVVALLAATDFGTGGELVGHGAGGHEGVNELVDGVWTCSTGAVEHGLRAVYADLAADLERRTGATLTALGALGSRAPGVGRGADPGGLPRRRRWC